MNKKLLEDIFGNMFLFGLLGISGSTFVIAIVLMIFASTEFFESVEPYIGIGFVVGGGIAALGVLGFFLIPTQSEGESKSDVAGAATGLFYLLLSYLFSTLVLTAVIWFGMIFVYAIFKQDMTLSTVMSNSLSNWQYTVPIAFITAAGLRIFGGK